MSSLPSPFTAAHRSYVKGLYRRFLQNELDWIVQRDLWRARALSIRAEFERNRCAPTTSAVGINLMPGTALPTLVLLHGNRNVHDPRALSTIFAKAEAALADRKHPDPYRRKCGCYPTGRLAFIHGAPSSRGSRWHEMVRTLSFIGALKHRSFPPNCLSTGNATCRYVYNMHVG